MLKFKDVTLFKQKKTEKKGGNFGNLVSRFCLILTKILFSMACKYFQGASPNINRVMAIFSPQPLKKWPPSQEKCKNVQFLHWILTDDDVYFQKITES